MKHYVKIFYGNFMDSLEKEVNEYTSQLAFQGGTAKIQNIHALPREHGGATIVIHYTSPYEVR